MVKLKKHDLSGKELGEIEVKDDLLEVTLSSQTIKNYLVAIRNNARQWSASTKGKAQVNHSNMKPRPQKGTGNARQGSLSSPQFRGGGIVHGPKPKSDLNFKVNRKEKKAVIHALLAEKIKEGKVHLLVAPEIEKPKTKPMVSFMEALQIHGTRTLFLTGTEKKAFPISIRNIPRTEFTPVEALNGYDLALAQEIVVTESALEGLLRVLGGNK